MCYNIVLASVIQRCESLAVNLFMSKDRTVGLTHQPLRKTPGHTERWHCGKGGGPSKAQKKYHSHGDFLFHVASQTIVSCSHSSYFVTWIFFFLNIVSFHLKCIIISNSFHKSKIFQSLNHILYFCCL